MTGSNSREYGNSRYTFKGRQRVIIENLVTGGDRRKNDGSFKHTHLAVVDLSILADRRDRYGFGFLELCVASMYRWLYRTAEYKIVKSNYKVGILIGHV